VIVDEAHQMYKEIFRWMKDCPPVLFIGLSATPWARGLGKYYDHLIVAATTADLIRDGYLSPSKAFAPSEPDLSNVRTIRGDFDEEGLAEAMDRPAITGDIVETWHKLGEGRPTFCFCVNRRHAQHVSERFVEAGVAAGYMDGETPREERKAIFDKLRSGEIPIICNVGVLTTGVDIPIVSCLIDAKPTRSRGLFVQTIGRGLRQAEGKKDCLILDHHLDDGMERQNAGQRARERGEPLPKLCEDCCGARMHARTEVEAIDGELVELGSRRSSAKTTVEDRAAFFSELKGHATLRGYDDGWASHKYRERFGVWPNDPRIRCATASPPSLKTKNWIVSRQIAFAKARERVAHG
jgi:DNA repair protein RadD